jgi:hypothetical protein
VKPTPLTAPPDALRATGTSCTVCETEIDAPDGVTLTLFTVVDDMPPFSPPPHEATTDVATTPTKASDASLSISNWREGEGISINQFSQLEIGNRLIGYRLRVRMLHQLNCSPRPGIGDRDFSARDPLPQDTLIPRRP